MNAVMNARDVLNSFEFTQLIWVVKSVDEICKDACEKCPVKSVKSEMPVEDSSKVNVGPVGLPSSGWVPSVFFVRNDQAMGHGVCKKINDYLDLVFEHVQDLGGAFNSTAEKHFFGTEKT